MTYSNIPLAQELVLACKIREIKDIVISPGSRNAPLILSFTSDSFFNCYSIVDERSAAFFGLGLSLHHGKPVVLVCTSGSALLNYYPAIAEAYYSNIPLVIISADRPTYKIDVGDGQTIRQDGVFDRHIGRSVNLKQDINHATEKLQRYNYGYNETQQDITNDNRKNIKQTLEYALRENLPVHFNAPFEEPLYGTQEDLIPDFSTSEIQVPTNPKFEFAEQELTLFNSSKKILILVGVHPPEPELKPFIDFLGRQKNVLVFTETTSNWNHSEFISSIDSILIPIEKSSNTKDLFEQLKPDLLITFGGLIVSKKIKAFLRSYQPTHHWHVHPYRAFDTFFCLTKHFKISSKTFISELMKVSTSPNNAGYKNFWISKKNQFQEKRNLYLKRIPFSDFYAFGHIFPHIPKKYNLHLSNSSTVRYAQLFELDFSLEVYCNRGTSGIDGSSSTAVGFALNSSKPTLLITGDLSFYYDINAFWNNYLRKDFRIILINNGGGGIFRILPGFQNKPNFTTFLETAQELDASQMAKHFNLEYNPAKNATELKDQLKSFFNPSEKAKILEIKTPREINDKILLDYFDFIT